MLWKSLALAYIANAQSPTYGKCSDDTKFDAKQANVKMEIVPQLTNSVIQVKGNIVITDKCNFESQNFTFINARESYWMGGYKGNADGITLSDQFVFPSAFPATFKYPLRQAAGAEVNFGGFNQFRLFERDTNTLIAVADMPAKTGSGNGNNTSGALTSSVLGAALLSLTWAFAF